MKKIAQNTVFACAIAALMAMTSFVASGGEHHSDEDSSPRGSIRLSNHPGKVRLVKLARISFQQALNDALSKVEGQAVNGELEVEDGNLQYSFDIVTADGFITEVEVDAGNGHILDVDRDSGNGRDGSDPAD